MKPEGKAAYQDLMDMKDDTKQIIDLLENVENRLEEVINKESKRIAVTKDNEPKEIAKRKGRMSRVLGTPERLVFPCCDHEFYIDFTVSTSEHEGKVIPMGSIIYGTSRERYGEEKNIQENKPLLEFSVNKNGLVESNRGVTGKWWIGERHKAKDETTEEKKNESKDRAKQLDELCEMHFRAMRHIWKDALKWTNENLLP